MLDHKSYEIGFNEPFSMTKSEGWCLEGRPINLRKPKAGWKVFKSLYWKTLWIYILALHYIRATFQRRVSRIYVKRRHNTSNVSGNPWNHIKMLMENPSWQFCSENKAISPFLWLLAPRPQCVCDILFTLAWDIASTISPNSKSLICNINNWNLSVHQSYDLGHQYHHAHDCLTWPCTLLFWKILSEILHFLK